MPFGPFLQFLEPFGYSLDSSWCWILDWILLLHILLLSTVTLKTFSMFDICILAGYYQERKNSKISEKKIQYIAKHM